MELLQVLSDVSESVSTVLCVGHNKGWEEAATTLCGQAVRLKNACAALLELRGVDWADVLSDEKDSQWKLVGVVGTKEA